MKIRKFSEAGWSPALLDQFELFQADAVEVTAKGNVTDQMKVTALNSIVESIGKIGAKFDCWLVIGHTAIQPDNRITKYKKLWGSLGIKTNEINSRHVAEWAVRGGDGVRYFGALQQPFDASIMASMLSKEQSSWLVMADPGLEALDFQRELGSGWKSSSLVIPTELLQLVGQKGFIFIKDFGSTTAREIGAIAIGPKDIISKMAAYIGLRLD